MKNTTKTANVFAFAQDSITANGKTFPAQYSINPAGIVFAFVKVQQGDTSADVRMWEFGDGLPTVNAVYLFELLTVLPDAVLLVDPENPFAPVYAASDLGDAVLLPIRPAKKQALASAACRIIGDAKKRNPERPEITLDQLAEMAADMAA